MGCVTLIASGSHPWKKAATWGGQKRERWRFETELFKKCLWTVLGQCKLVFYFYLLIFEIGLHSTKCWSWTHYVVEVGLKVLILLSLPPEFWDYNYAPPPGCDLVFFFFIIVLKPRTSWEVCCIHWNARMQSPGSKDRRPLQKNKFVWEA